MGERKMLVKSSGEEKNQAKRTVEGQRQRIIEIPAGIILASSNISGAMGAGETQSKPVLILNDSSEFDFNGPET
jgi:hypothetical protein